MGGNSFRFKQFTLFQQGVAMKLGVDSVLLGAWCNAENCTTILDVGCGTGILSLMVAQRFGSALIDAIELDGIAFAMAGENVKNSPFAQRINVIHGDFCKYSSGSKYDFIITNPPYFRNSMKASTQQRTMARHNDLLRFEVLVKKSAQLLNSNGYLSLILPVDAFERFDSLAWDEGLFCQDKCLVIPYSGARPNRVLLRYGFSKVAKNETSITVRNSDRVYSDEYKELTREFYL